MNWRHTRLRLRLGTVGLVCFALACIFSLIVAILVPGAAATPTAGHVGLENDLRAGRRQVTIRGIDNLPPDSCVVVANHASYIDGVC